MPNSKTSMLREQLGQAHRVLEGVMQDVTPEVAQWQPAGKAHTIAGLIGHVMTTEDGIINGLLKGGAPLMMSSHQGKTGLSEMPPTPTADGLPDWQAWGQRLRLDPEAMHAYATAVFAATDAYLETMSDADLDKSVQTAVGERSVFDMLNGAVLANCQWHAGEIAAIKGLQGLKGYPF